MIRALQAGRDHADGTSQPHARRISRGCSSCTSGGTTTRRRWRRVSAPRSTRRRRSWRRNEVKKWGEVSLGVVTSIGGFLEVGSIATSSAGRRRVRLPARLGAGAWHAEPCVPDGDDGPARRGQQANVRGSARANGSASDSSSCPSSPCSSSVCSCVASEIGGVSIALELASGIDYRWWAIPVALLGWFLLWRGTFGIVEQGTATSRPRVGQLRGGRARAASDVANARTCAAAVDALARPCALLVSRREHPRRVDQSVSLPVLLRRRDRGRVDASSISASIVSPRESAISSAGCSRSPCSSARRSSSRHGTSRWSATSRSRSCSRARLVAPASCSSSARCSSPASESTLEIVLAMAYLLAQGFGWNWSENLKPGKDARFATSYTVLILLAALPIALGMDPLSLTNISMVATAASLPVTVIPLARAHERWGCPVHARERMAEQRRARRHRTALARAARRGIAAAASRRWMTWAHCTCRTM